MRLTLRHPCTLRLIQVFLLDNFPLILPLLFCFFSSLLTAVKENCSYSIKVKDEILVMCLLSGALWTLFMLQGMPLNFNQQSCCWLNGRKMANKSSSLSISLSLSQADQITDPHIRNYSITYTGYSGKRTLKQKTCLPHVSVFAISDPTENWDASKRQSRSSHKGTLSTSTSKFSQSAHNLGGPLSQVVHRNWRMITPAISDEWNHGLGSP